MRTLYDHRGRPVAYVDRDDTSIYLYGGDPVAWLSRDSVYAYSGRYLGWTQNGWFYDRTGKPAFFTPEATGGPAKPAKQAKPARGGRGARPSRGGRESRPARPARSTTWSDLSGEAYFDH